jgi:5-methylcytosine-specific restriction endonuclease McrA
MSKTKSVRVELDGIGNVVRIFRDHSWLNYDPEFVRIMDRAEAVGEIRYQVYSRTRNEDGYHECEKCGREIKWETMEMNEKRPKGAGGGKTGGEVSLTNCEALCPSCHQGNKDSAHGNRRWHTAKLPVSPEGQ